MLFLPSYDVLTLLLSELITYYHIDSVTILFTDMEERTSSKRKSIAQWPHLPVLNRTLFMILIKNELSYCLRPHGLRLLSITFFYVAARRHFSIWTSILKKSLSSSLDSCRKLFLWVIHVSSIFTTQSFRSGPKKYFS